MPGARSVSSMTPRAVEFAALVETITGDHNFDVALLAFGWDATFIQDAMFGCEQYEGGFNMVKYCNEQVDELNAQAKRTFDEDGSPRTDDRGDEHRQRGAAGCGDALQQGELGYSDRLQNYKPGPWGVDSSIRLDSAVDDVPHPSIPTPLSTRAGSREHTPGREHESPLSQSRAGRGVGVKVTIDRST